MNDKSALRAAAAGATVSADAVQADPIHVDESTEVNLTIEHEEVFSGWIAENAIIDPEEAKRELTRQFIENPQTAKFRLEPAQTRSGAQEELPVRGVPLCYDAQGTQLGGGKAYLDKGQAVARVDITAIF